MFHLSPGVRDLKLRRSSLGHRRIFGLIAILIFAHRRGFAPSCRVGMQQQKEKGTTHMAIALQNKQLYAALIIVAILTLIAITFTVLSVEHINLWQAATKLIPAASFGSM